MATGSQYLNGRVTVLGTTASGATEILSFTIPSAGTWTVDYFLTMGLVNGSSNCNAVLFDGNNVSVANSQITLPYGWNTTTPFTANKTILVTTTGPSTFKLKGWGGNNSFPQGQTQYLVDGGGAGVVYLADPVTIAKGDKGDQGIQGIQGIQGATGLKGDRGDQGIQGVVGPQGIQGPVGPKGDRGDHGAVGPIGPKGDVGQTGTQGLRGATGTTGSIGAQGLRGATGATGATGLGFSTAAVNTSGQLVIAKTDRTSFIAGSVVGPRGIQGPVGPANTGPAFIANITSGTSIPIATGPAIAQLPLIYNNVIKNDGFGFNPVTGIFTAPIAGYYQVSVGFAPGMSQQLNVFTGYYGAALSGIYKNNVPVAAGQWVEAKARSWGSYFAIAIDPSSVSSLIFLNAGDTLQSKVAYITNYSGFTTYANVVSNYFQAVWIRA